MKLREALRAKLTKKELKNLKASFETVGDIAILEIDPELEKKEKLIAQTLLDLNKNIKTVCKKLGDRAGRYRLRKYKILAGDSTETIHKESGCRFKVDIRKAYFSTRESTERERISKQVRPGEKVLVMFSGTSPSGVTIAKRQPKARVVCVELNPKAVEYADENLKLNGVRTKVENICGDVRKVCPKFGKFDRITAPLPELAYKYLDVMFVCSKKGTIIHLYGISEEKNLYKGLLDEIKRQAKISGKQIRILRKRKVLPYRPRTFKICVKFKVL